jgi:hypothetical protein
MNSMRARLNVSGSDETGDLAHGVLVRLLLGHFRQTPVPPRIEQVVKRASEIVTERSAEKPDRPGVNHLDRT